jgi:hypothetical protein
LTPLDQLFRPLEIIRAVVFGLQCAEQGIVFEPAFLRGTPLVICRNQILAFTRFEVFPRLLKEAMFERDDRVVIDHLCGDQSFAIVRVQ